MRTSIRSDRNAFTNLLKIAATESDNKPRVYGGDGILDSAVSASQTLNDDPGRHKLKGLASLAGAGIAMNAGRQLTASIPKVPIPASAAPSQTSLLLIPAGAYYSYVNKDDVRKRRIGLATAGLGILAAGASAPAGVVVPTLTNGQRVAQLAAVIAPTALTVNAVHELHKANELQKNKENPNRKLTKDQKIENKYPILTLTPWRQRLNAYVSALKDKFSL